MTFPEYETYDAVGLADLIARRAVTPGEVLDAAMERMEAINPRVNAVVRPLEAQARQSIEKGLPEGPLRGVPFLLKDITARMQGIPTSAGSRLFADMPVDRDSAIVTSYRQAGLVIFGKTNTPELGLAATTEPALFGATRNPWNLDRTPGGSSGGSAAAVAAGIVPAANASDGGGSIRTPASCCGLFGLKPSRGRVSMAPAGEGWGGLSVQHAVSRSIRDSATLLDIVCRPQSGDPYWAPPPLESFAAQVGRDPGRLRIGYTTAALTWGILDPECARAVEDAAALCQSLGHQVDEVALPGDFQKMAIAVNTVVAASAAATLDQEAQRRASPIREDEVEKLTWSMYQEGKRWTAVQFVAAMQTLHGFSRTFARVFGDLDVLLLSTLGSPPVPLGWMNTNADLDGYGERLYSFMPNTQPFNVSGLPAASIPLGWAADGLPIGIQIAVDHGKEGLLLRLASQLEQARPWAARRPLGAGSAKRNRDGPG